VVGVEVQRDDVGVVDETVDGRRGHNVVAEGLCPAGECELDVTITDPVS
jgi:hypothetical protein